jgi:5-methyltetrahydrofolate--homocysteine methyltransferase
MINDIMDIQSIVKQKVLVLDGAMGTMIQNQELSEEDFKGSLFNNLPYELKGVNDVLCLTRPDIVKQIHKQYLDAGADIITTNSFNANEFSLKEYNIDSYSYQINFEAAKLAKEVIDAYKDEETPRFVAGTLGPTTKTASISPNINQPGLRDVSFDELVEVYYTQAKGLIDGGVDVLLVETIFDTLNAKAALYAINRLKSGKKIDIPVMVSGTIDDSGRTLSGQTVEAFFNSLQPFNLFSIGLNCSFGAEKLTTYLERLAVKSTVNVSAHPNAGLPNEFGNYDQSAIEMARQIEKYLANGLVNIVGGCCGTTPDHVKAISRISAKYNPRVILPHSRTTRLSGLQSLGIKDATRLIKVGERTNATGSKKFLRLVQEEKYQDALLVAKNQIEAGADILNISVDESMIDGKEVLPYLINLLSSEPDVASLPFMIDSSHFDVIESALKGIQGKAIVNSISLKDGEEKFREQALKIHQLGASAIVMAFDEKGQADTYERKIEISARAYEIWTNQLGLSPEDLIFDPNVLSIGTGIEDHNHYGKDFLMAVQWIKQNLPYSKVNAGISNVSFAFRGNEYLREVINSVFLHHCQNAGLDFAIVNPEKLYAYSDIPPKLVRYVEDMIFYLRKDAADRLLELAEKYGKKGKKKTEEVKWRKLAPEKRIAYAIENGINHYLGQDIRELVSRNTHPMDVIEGPLVSGMNKVGKLFGEGKMFLPQVIKSARVMNEAVDILMPHLEKEKDIHQTDLTSQKVLLATVEGDVHDIGKNILSLVLSSNNFDVVDLGVMVPNDQIIKRVHDEKPDILGLSGLITPSLDQMVDLLRDLEKENISIPVIVGGATTSAIHTAVKMAPVYSGVVIQVSDASKSVNVTNRLAGKESGKYIEDVKAEQDKLRKDYFRRKRERRKVSFRDARRQRYMYNYKGQKPVKPRMLGTKVFEDFDLNLLRKYIDWTPFFHGWGLKGVFPQILEKDKVGREAKRVFEEAQEMLGEIIDEKLIHPKGIIGLFPANSDADDILVFKNDERKKIVKRIPMLRQQQLRDKKGYALSLSDYIAPVDSGIKDYFGGFAVTTGLGTDEHVQRFKQKGDSYNSIMFRLIADRLVEAFAEVLHEWVRKKYWGYEPYEDLSKEELIKEKYQGIRPAPGYPACPDHSLKGHLFELMDVENEIGIELTDSYAMRPASSVSGFYIAHNASKYFGIGKIGKDQIRDYARRTKMEVKEAEKWLQSVLDYDK